MVFGMWEFLYKSREVLGGSEVDDLEIGEIREKI